MKRLGLNKFIIIILIPIILTSCKKAGSKKGAKIEVKEKAPKSLVSVSEELDKIFTSVGEIKEIMDLSPSEFEILKGKDQEKDKKDGKDKKDEKSADKSIEDKEEINPKDKEITKKWNEIDKNIEKVHKSWNDYEVEATKKSPSSEKTKEFKKGLNSLTKAVESRNTGDILDMGSKSILPLSGFFDLYKDEISGEISKIKYAVYQASLIGETDVESAKILLDSTEEPINRLRQKMTKDKAKIKTLDKLGLAIEDMKQSLGEGNKKLLELKKDIIISNLKLLEK